MTTMEGISFSGGEIAVVSAMLSAFVAALYGVARHYNKARDDLVAQYKAQLESERAIARERLEEERAEKNEWKQLTRDNSLDFQRFIQTQQRSVSSTEIK